MSAISELSSITRRKGKATAAEKKANGRDNKAAYIFLLPDPSRFWWFPLPRVVRIEKAAPYQSKRFLDSCIALC